MNDQTFIDIASAHLVSTGLSTADMTPHVEHSPDSLVEVAFVDNAGARDRVFLTSGSLIGIVLADGTTPDYRFSDPALTPNPGEEPVDAAMRYLDAHRIATANLQPQIVDDPKLVKVSYSNDLTPSALDGGYTLYIDETGTVVRCDGVNAGTIAFPSGLQWQAGTRLYTAAVEAATQADSIDAATVESLKEAHQSGRLVIGEFDESVSTALMAILQSETYRDRLAAVVTGADFADASTRRVEELHSLALGEIDLPEWLACDDRGIIVKGLHLMPFAQVLGAVPWPMQTSRVGNTIRYCVPESSVVIDVELERSSQPTALDAVVADVGDARFVVSGNGADPGQLNEVAIALAQAHAQANV